MTRKEKAGSGDNFQEKGRSVQSKPEMAQVLDLERQGLRKLLQLVSGHKEKCADNERQDKKLAMNKNYKHE